MITHPSSKHRVSVVQKVVGGDGRRYIGAARLYEVDQVLGGTVLHHHAEARVLAEQWSGVVDEDEVAIQVLMAVVIIIIMMMTITLMTTMIIIVTNE